jgi:tetratricopeptide (TPR) repeat protein
MAASAMEAGDYPRALRYCEASWQDDVAPEYWPAWRTAGVTIRRMSERVADPQRKRFLLEQAFEHLAQAVRLGAGGDPAAMLGTAELSIELGGDYAQAIRLVGEFVRFRPAHASAFDNLARWLLSAEPPELRDPQRALQCAREAHRLKPEVANYIATLVDALIATGQTQEARVLIDDTINTLPPDSPGISEFEKRLRQLDP